MFRPHQMEDQPISAIGCYLPAPAPGKKSVRRLSAVLDGAFAAIRLWQIRARQKKELLMLDAVELRELSLTRADVEREASKPIWRPVRF